MGYHVYEVPVYSQENYKNTFYVNHIDLLAHIFIWISRVSLLYFVVKEVTLIVKKKKALK